MLETFKKHKSMMRIELLGYLQPKEMFKLAMANRKMHELVDSAKFNQILIIQNPEILEFLEKVEIKKLSEFGKLSQVVQHESKDLFYRYGTKEILGN